MLGIFLVNTKGQVCLARYDVAENDADIAGINYLPASRITAITLQGQDEEVMLDEVKDEIHAALMNIQSVLVVHMDMQSVPIREYVVPLRK